jgi:hypothetical protein
MQENKRIERAFTRVFPLSRDKEPLNRAFFHGKLSNVKSEKRLFFMRDIIDYAASAAPKGPILTIFPKKWFFSFAFSKKDGNLSGSLGRCPPSYQENDSMFISRFCPPSRQFVAIVCLCAGVFFGDSNLAQATYRNLPATSGNVSVPIASAGTSNLPAIVGPILYNTGVETFNNGFNTNISVHEVVFADSNNPNNVGSSNDLTFVYQVQVNAPTIPIAESEIVTVPVSSFFAGFALDASVAPLVTLVSQDVGQLSVGLNSTTPQTMVGTVSSSGGIITFGFGTSLQNPPSGPLNVSYELIIQTNAVTVIPGEIAPTDGQSSSFGNYTNSTPTPLFYTPTVTLAYAPFETIQSPVTPSPGPSTITVFGIGSLLAGFGWLRRRKDQGIAPVLA